MHLFELFESYRESSFVNASKSSFGVVFVVVTFHRALSSTQKQNPPAGKKEIWCFRQNIDSALVVVVC